MKLLLVLSLTLILFSAKAACIPDRYVKICRGDKVVAENTFGEVIAVNYLILRVAIMFEIGKKHLGVGVGAYDIDEVSLAKGCMLGICVGDRVLLENNESLVIGINPITKKISHRFLDDVSGREIKTSNMIELSVTKMNEEIDIHNHVRYTSTLAEYNNNF